MADHDSLSLSHTQTQGNTHTILDGKIKDRDEILFRCHSKLQPISLVPVDIFGREGLLVSALHSQLSKRHVVIKLRWLTDLTFLSG